MTTSRTWQVGDSLQTRSGGSKLAFEGWVSAGIARCRLGKRTFDLPADILKAVGTEPRGRRKGRPIGRHRANQGEGALEAP